MRTIVLLTAMLLASAIAWAQTQSTPPPASAQPTSPQTQNPAASGSQTPANPQQPAPAVGNHRVLQAKSQDELKAYQDAIAKTDAAQAEAAAKDFAAKFPNSDLRGALYIRAMNIYAQAGNSEKVIELGREAIAADPINPVPLMEVASTLSETTRDTDLDREQRLAEAAKDAHAAIDNLDTGLLLPANPDPEKVAGAKRTILTNSYTALGVVGMSRNDYSAAAGDFQKAIDASKDNPEAVLYLRLSVAQDKLKDYQQALDSANKAVQYAPAGTPAQSLAKQQQERLQKLINADNPGAAGAPPGPPSPTPFPGAQTSPTPGAPAGSSPIPGQSTQPR
jgi:tetratricopeptide (TPR) repeat protein